MNKLIIISFLSLTVELYGCNNKVILTESDMVPCTPFSHKVIVEKSDDIIDVKYSTVRVYCFTKNRRKKEPVYDLEIIAKMEGINKSAKTDFDGKCKFILPVGTHEFLFKGIGFCDKLLGNVDVHTDWMAVFTDKE
jgi:hypothetical protein